MLLLMLISYHLTWLIVTKAFLLEDLSNGLLIVTTRLLNVGFCCIRNVWIVRAAVLDSLQFVTTTFWWLMLYCILIVQWAFAVLSAVDRASESTVTYSLLWVLLDICILLKLTFTVSLPMRIYSSFGVATFTVLTDSNVVSLRMVYCEVWSSVSKTLINCGMWLRVTILMICTVCQSWGLWLLTLWGCQLMFLCQFLIVWSKLLNTWWIRYGHKGSSLRSIILKELHLWVFYLCSCSLVNSSLFTNGGLF